MTQLMAEQPTLKIDDAEKYLKLYVADIQWRQHIVTLFDRLKKYNNETEAKALLRKQVSCTILLPSHDKSTLTDPPENLLFWVGKYSQFDSRDWFSDLQTTMHRDNQIEQWRNEALSRGIIYPLEYAPITRQAFNWLFAEVEKSDIITSENKKAITDKFQNLVLAYGGAVVCNIFMKEQLKPKINKILNWRTGYFFERLIFDVYSKDEVIKIKDQEIKKTNPKLVKTIRQD